MQPKIIPYTMGLDIGMASVGVALLAPREEKISGLHVRTFEKAEAPKGESLNAKRREARSARRRIRRRAFRMVRLLRLMRRTGLIEEATPESFFLQDVSPWDLRVAGLDRVLTEKEWGTVIYHIIKHRGFLSNRKSEAKENEKTGQMLSGANANHARIKERKYRTVGEMIASDDLYAMAKRNKGGDYNHTLLRADLKDELESLFDKQRSFGSAYADTDFEKTIIHYLMERRPTASGDDVRDKVGNCSFEKDELRAPKASYRAQRFVWLQKLNNLKILGPHGARSLTPDERWEIIELPFTLSKLTFAQVRKKLGISSDERFNLCTGGTGGSNKGKKGGKEPESATFFEAKYYHALRKAYEAAGLKVEWERDSQNPDRLDLLAEALTFYKVDDEIRDWLQERDVEEPIIEAALHVSFTKVIHLSQKALKNLLPHMEKGERYDEAAASAGYDHSNLDGENKKYGLIPPIDRNAITNPVVRRALNQARKLVNAVIREYGPPMALHIELARDLSRPFKERNEITTAQEKYQKEKKAAREHYISVVGSEPKKDDLLKYRLFLQQLDQCPYCQQGLHVERLSEPGYAQVDHILPYSRSSDDSLNNKVVVHTHCNQNKGNLTPYEFLGGEEQSPQWRSFEAWVRGAANIRRAKRDRLLRVNFGHEEASGFRERHLNDTRYICREFKRMVESSLRWHPDSDAKNRCVVVSGQLTALLRTRWGLLKVRENGDLHHALDAAVVAAASRGLVKRMADYSRRREVKMLRECVDPETGEILDEETLNRAEKHFPEPWPHFKQELVGLLSPDPAKVLEATSGYQEGDKPHPVRVSRPPKMRGTGEAHKETIRSRVGEEKSAIRTSLTELTLNNLHRIAGFHRDKKLVEAIRERLEAYGGDGKKAFGPGTEPLRKPSHDPKKAPIIRRVRLVNESQKSGIPVRKGIADNGSMIRLDIFRKGKKFFGIPIYVHHITKEELPMKATIGGKPEEEWEVMDENDFLFSLHPNDWVRLTLKKEVREGYYGGFDRATAAISIWTHDRNQKIGKKGEIRGNGIKTALSVEKFRVDMLGRLHPLPHEKRRSLHYLKSRG